jgi:hypothetical protein
MRHLSVSKFKGKRYDDVIAIKIKLLTVLAESKYRTSYVLPAMAESLDILCQITKNYYQYFQRTVWNSW